MGEELNRNIFENATEETWTAEQEIEWQKLSYDQQYNLLQEFWNRANMATKEYEADPNNSEKLKRSQDAWKSQRCLFHKIKSPERING